MENFQYYNPVKVLFGAQVLDKLCSEIEIYGKKALIVIGKGSVKKNGLYAQVISLLNIAGINHYTYEGIKANPWYQDADEAINFAKENNVDMVIAIGGGSVIDTAKAIAMGFYANHSVWDFYKQKVPKASKALPVFPILTLAATGTEMNSSTVLQDSESGQKLGYSAPCLFPKVSFLDPTYTLTVPINYTVYGIADLISHALEQFFGKGDAPLADLYTASVIKLAVEYGKKIVVSPHDFDVRSQIMWLATNALNGTLKAGKNSGDWGVHALEHTFSVLYDIPHGAGLSIVYPAWLKLKKLEILDKLSFLAKEVFNYQVDDINANADVFIYELENFFNDIGTPTRLQQVDISRDETEKIIENFKLNKVNGSVYKLSENDYRLLLEKMWS